MPLFLPTGTELVDKARFATQSMYAWMRDLTNAFNSSNGFAPADATYHVRTADSSLPNARVATDSASVTLDYSTPGQVKWNSVGGGTVTTTGSPANGNLTKFSGATSITNGDLSGDVSTTGTLVTTIGTNKVTSTMLRQGVATSVIGRSANSTGNEADIQSSNDQEILGRRSSVLGFTRIDAFGYWSPLTNGDPVTPELVFDGSGDTISIWTDL